MTKKRFHTSLQLKLTLLLSLLMIVSCVLMYFFISHSAVSGMDGLQNYMIKVDPQDGDSPITFNVDPKALFPQFEQEIQETKEDFLLRSVIATTIIILLSSVCTYFLTKKTLTPLQKLTSEVSQIQAQNLSTQLAVPNSKDEIAQLTSSFNEMLARLDNAFSTQKQFSANAAHELRTPLAVLQTNLEVFEKKQEPEMVEYQQLFTMIREQTTRLSQLVGTLLDMTNLKSVPRTDQVALEELVDEVFCDLDPVAEKAGISIHFDDNSSQDWHTDVHTPDASALNNNIRNITGSYVLLYRAVYNLVENAIKYNRPNGSVTVSVKEKNGQAMILVKDTGIGISPENQKKIFDPFFRVDKSRSRAMGGAGLGLALVDSIAREHGGSVKVLESNEKGSIIALMLPVSSLKN
ncbi:MULTISPECIES: HAMP domain-containing sensor histidine kinase [unclassified Ruminococcus]|uniref:HAMP domain-containing sensor histidine kinase n=1 Tax=unclassified Ruminococcus TaxID=2608920 RepID=UPI001FAD716C|nr:MULTISPECIES: HAMP domain-containing sensor histidine kinase [unclassified Ruminococcus]MDB8776281.1 HAMP domain-containing sensor histidine kinase [Ruminococcus sp. 1001136sp1]